jgi:hypothetical protein
VKQPGKRYRTSYGSEYEVINVDRDEIMVRIYKNQHGALVDHTCIWATSLTTKDVLISVYTFPFKVGDSVRPKSTNNAERMPVWKVGSVGEPTDETWRDVDGNAFMKEPFGLLEWELVEPNPFNVGDSVRFRDGSRQSELPITVTALDYRNGRPSCHLHGKDNSWTMYGGIPADLLELNQDKVWEVKTRRGLPKKGDSYVVAPGDSWIVLKSVHNFTNLELDIVTSIVEKS